jgi:hypothetical protein
MGMTIDDAIEWYVGLDCYTPQAKDARNVAIDTMRKYQKIEQILKDIPYGGDITVRRIQEVVEDG